MNRDGSFCVLLPAGNSISDGITAAPSFLPLQPTPHKCTYTSVTEIIICRLEAEATNGIAKKSDSPRVSHALTPVIANNFHLFSIPQFASFLACIAARAATRNLHVAKVRARRDCLTKDTARKMAKLNRAQRLNRFCRLPPIILA